MEGSTTADTTQLLRAWADGDSGALEQLTPRVYRELRHLAARLLRNERPGYTLQSTDLVHEVYLRLVNAEELNWQHRAHFFAVAATLMRRILMDRARRKAAAKREAIRSRSTSAKLWTSPRPRRASWSVWMMRSMPYPRWTRARLASWNCDSSAD